MGEDRRVKARITITLYDNDEVDIKCEGDMDLCMPYITMLKVYAENFDRLVEAAKRLRGKRGTA